MNPLFAYFNLGPWELILVLSMPLLLLAALIVGLVFLIRYFKGRKPAVPPLPQPPPVAATVALKKCPQCHAPLAPDAPEGLCPRCLARAAFGTEPAAPGATINVNPAAEAAAGARVPPEVAELASQFPQLEILELLGMGGMGMVYKARQPRLDRFVALKILPLESLRHPSFAERFNREAKALAKLNHPGIVAVYDFGQTDRYYYFIMEFVDGMNLRQLLQTQPLEPRQALELVTQICTALQYAHDEGVVHRDIKPENILLSKKGQLKIADFGLAKLLGVAPDTALTMSQAAMGTMNYMAPEQRQNAQGVDHRADIYSLGVVFYEMLTGEVPMGRFDAPSKRVQVDVRLDEVVLRALEREPARRYQHVSEVKTDVESFTEGRPGSRAGGQPRQPRNERPVVVAEAVKILALCGVIGLAMGTLNSAWPLALLLMHNLRFDQTAGPQERRWVTALWVVGVVGLCGYGVWISNSAWPVVGLVLLFDWGKDEEAESGPEEDPIPAAAGAPTQNAKRSKAPAGAGLENAAKELNPQLVWMKYFGLFCVGWLATKFLWNFRGPGCWLASLGMASLVTWISLKHMRRFPVQRANWSKFPLRSRISAIVVNVGCLTVLCFPFLIGGAFNYWDENRMNGNYSSRSVEQYEAEYKGKEYHLLQNLPAFSKEIPTVEMRGGYNGYSAGWFFGWGGGPGPGHHYNSAGPNLVVGGFSLFLFTFAIIGSYQFPPGTKKWILSWRHLRASLGICTAAFLSLFLVGQFAEATHLGSPRSGSFTRYYNCKADMDTVTQAIQTWADQNGYALGDTMDWNLNTVPKGERVAEARLREAWKPSPFDRWHSTPMSFRRVSPWLAFELVGSEKPAETRVTVTGAMDVSPDQASRQIPESLSTMLERLQSSPGESSTDKSSH